MKPGPALLAAEARRAAMSIEDRLNELGNKLVMLDSESREGKLMLRAVVKIERLKATLLQCAQDTNDNWVHDLALEALERKDQ